MNSLDHHFYGNTSAILRRSGLRGGFKDVSKEALRHEKLIERSTFGKLQLSSEYGKTADVDAIKRIGQGETLPAGKMRDRLRDQGLIVYDKTKRRWMLTERGASLVPVNE